MNRIVPRTAFLSRYNAEPLCKKHNLVDILMIVFMGVLCG